MMQHYRTVVVAPAYHFLHPLGLGVAQECAKQAAVQVVQDCDQEVLVELKCIRKLQTLDGIEAFTKYHIMYECFFIHTNGKSFFNEGLNITSLPLLYMSNKTY